METCRRLVLWILMFLATVLFFAKGREASEKEASAAFVHSGSPKTVVRLKGNNVNPGIYEFAKDTSLMTVTKMTVRNWSAVRTDFRKPDRVLSSGDIIDFAGSDGQRIEITVKRMPAKEMMVLGIPLDPNRMDINDWESLPGIGPALALRIVEDRQNNGDYGSIAELERVPGIGKKKIKKISYFFDASCN